MTRHSREDRVERDSQPVDRRHFLGIGTGVGVTLLAGCTAQSDSGTNGTSGTGSDDGTTDSQQSTMGSFRLLISDQPVDIGDFDSLNVSFDRARLFGGQDGDDEEGDQETNESETQDETNETETQDETNETQTQEGTNESTTDQEEGDDELGDQAEDDDEEAEQGDDEEGFSTIDLGGATVDLTQVVGDKAIGVFEGELSAGQYSKIELYASNVEGVVDGESVGVKIPSGKLQIVKPFEIVPEEPVSFVFDINVVKKGNTGEYNLLPVISESGVAGKDVDVEEVDEDGDDAGDDEAEDDEDEAADGNATDDADDTNSTDSSTDTNTTNETSGNEQ